MQALILHFKSILYKFVDFFKFKNKNRDFELSKTSWLINLRWAAVILLILLIGPALYFEYLTKQNLLILIGLICLMGLINLFSALYIQNTKKKIGPLFLCSQLTIDMFFLTLILFITAGFKNPLTSFFIIHAAIGALLIKEKYNWPFLLLCHCFLGILQIDYVQKLGNEFDLQSMITIWIYHLTLVLTWLLMRSFGSFIESHFSSMVQSEVKLAKFDRLRAVGALTAGFSHEFASPLNAIKLHLERLERNSTKNFSLLASDLQKDFQEILTSVDKCQSVIQQINSSQMDVRDYQNNKVNFKDFLTDVVDSWSDMNLNSNVHFECETNDLISIPILQFAQALLNLLDNAYQANVNGKIEIIFQKNTDSYFLSISDQGSGFSQTVLEKLGEPFITTKENGTGLGLYICNILAQSLNGELILKQRYNENKKNIIGATVTISWPKEKLKDL